MKKLIELDAALDAIGEVPTYNDGMVFEALSHAQRDVALLQTVDAVPVKHGRWIKWFEVVHDAYCISYAPHYKCSECNTEYDQYDAMRMNYCPNCGVKLDWKDGDGNC